MPKQPKIPKQGEIFNIEMSETDENGHIISGTHYGIVISPDVMNAKLQTAMIVLVTSRYRAGWDWRVPFKIPKGNPNITSYAMTDQLMTVDRTVFCDSAGFVKASDLKVILGNIREIFKDKHGSAVPNLH